MGFGVCDEEPVVVVVVVGIIVDVVVGIVVGVTEPTGVDVITVEESADAADAAESNEFIDIVDLKKEKDRCCETISQTRMKLNFSEIEQN